MAQEQEKMCSVLEANTYGGQIVRSPEVENYPGIAHISGYEFAQNLYDQAVNLGAAVEFENVVEIRADGQEKYVVTEDNEYTAVRSFLPQVQSTVRSAWMVKMTLWVREFPIVPHVTALFSKERMWLLSAAAARRWKTPSFYRLIAARFI